MCLEGRGRVINGGFHRLQTGLASNITSYPIITDSAMPNGGQPTCAYIGSLVGLKYRDLAIWQKSAIHWITDIMIWISTPLITAFNFHNLWSSNHQSSVLSTVATTMLPSSTVVLGIKFVVIKSNATSEQTPYLSRLLQTGYLCDCTLIAINTNDFPYVYELQVVLFDCFLT